MLDFIPRPSRLTPLPSLPAPRAFQARRVFEDRTAAPGLDFGVTDQLVIMLGVAAFEFREAVFVLEIIGQRDRGRLPEACQRDLFQ